MKFKNKAVIGINLNDGVESILNTLKEVDFLTYYEIHLVYVFQTTTYALGISELPLTYTVSDNRGIIEKSVIDRLQHIADGLFLNTFNGKVKLKCLFDESPKRKFCEYLDEVQPGMVIVTTRENRGLFESSFAQYVMKHTTSNILIVKEKH